MQEEPQRAPWSGQVIAAGFWGRKTRLNAGDYFARRDPALATSELLEIV
jgi:hypothetical protein